MGLIRIIVACLSTRHFSVLYKIGIELSDTLFRWQTKKSKLSAQKLPAQKFVSYRQFRVQNDKMTHSLCQYHQGVLLGWVLIPTTELSLHFSYTAEAWRLLWPGLWLQGEIVPLGWLVTPTIRVSTQCRHMAGRGLTHYYKEQLFGQVTTSHMYVMCRQTEVGTCYPT